MTEDNPFKDTIHVVYVEEVLRHKKYLCSLEAFDGRDKSVFLEHELHEIGAAKPNEDYKVGDQVHFRYSHREVEEKEIDGRLCDEGVWVKGTIEEIDKKRRWFTVSHTPWEEGGYDQLDVPSRDLRPAYK